jgi:membrane complex biogenesis BtpA family protein
MPLFRSRRKLFIGVVHLQPLPGAPRWSGDFEEILEFAVKDAKAYQSGGADAVFIENFGDVPFTRGRVGPETIAAMAAAGRAVRATIKIPIGFNVLRNDPCAALALCAVCDGSFVRVNVHTGAMVTDQGIIEGNAFETLRFRKAIAPGSQIFADVHVKHAVPLGPSSIADAARDSVSRGLADALIVSGAGTGFAVERGDLELVRRSCPTARILVGSGATLANLSVYAPFVDGFIVGSSLKVSGRITAPVDRKRVAAFSRKLREL